MTRHRIAGCGLLGLCLCAALAPAQPAPAPADASAPAKVPAAPAPPAARGLTTEELARLEKVVLEKGSNIPIPPDIAALLHFSPREIGTSVRQATTQDGEGIRHGFALLNDGSGFFLFRRGPERDGLAVFRTDRQFHLLGAARNLVGKRFIDLADAEARAELQVELNAWTQVLSPGGSVPRAALPRTVQPPAGAAPGN